MNYEIPKSRDLDIHDLAIPKQDVVKVDIVSDIQPPTKEVIPLHEVAPHLDNSHMQFTYDRKKDPYIIFRCRDLYSAFLT